MQNLKRLLWRGGTIKQLLRAAAQNASRAKIQPLLYLQINRVFISGLVSAGLLYLNNLWHNTKLAEDSHANPPQLLGASDGDSEGDEEKLIRQTLKQIPELTKKKFDDAVKQKKIVVVLLNIQYYKVDFAVNIILDLQKSLAEAQRRAAKPINVQIFQVTFQSREEVEEFQKTYNLTNQVFESIYLVKNNIFDTFQEISFED